MADKPIRPKLAMSIDGQDYWTTQSDDGTQVCVGIISKRKRLTRDEFLERLQNFIDTAYEKDLQFLDVDDNQTSQH